MPRVLARIQAHPSRADLLPPLLESLKPLPVEISLHSSEPPNPWAGYQQALSNLPDCTHLLILQDDVIACRNFPLAVERIAEAKPNTPIILFLANLPRLTANDSLRAANKGLHYVRLRIREFCPCVGILWPRAKAEELMAWVAENPKVPGYPRPRSDDAVLGRWSIITRQEILCTIPSLVEHPDTVPSLIGRRAAWGKDKGRVALQWIGDQDPLEIDWS